jgi:hypothetical protein
MIELLNFIQKYPLRERYQSEKLDPDPYKNSQDPVGIWDVEQSCFLCWHHEQEEKDISVLYLHISSSLLLLLNFIIELFLVSSRTFINIRRQYRVGVL